MNNYPNFSDQGYQIIRELGHNNIGGRVTYLAENIHTQKKVVIKLFQFAKLGATWAEYDAYSQEIEVLKSLQHPSIPQYLDSFQTTDGFCMIQEYINAESAQTFLMWQPQEIKQIAISILEILVYLQSQAQPVIHRDIKPENILIDEELNVYLVDFGFARMGGGEIAASSVVKGTMGFMSPEQMFNRQLTTASDLYSLGATLICLLTGIKSADIGNLIDANYRIIFRHLVPPLQRGWINWLEKMTEPKSTDRYKNAEVALAALKPLDVNRLPKVRISQENLEFSSSKWGEKLTDIIWVSNPIPETILSGRWEVVPHVSDPPHTSYDHSWISFSPHKFESNHIGCEITIDTSKLVENEIYKREIFLHSNSASEIETINVEVKTGSVTKLETGSVLMFFFSCFLVAMFIFYGFNLLQINTVELIPSVVIIFIAVLVYGFPFNVRNEKFPQVIRVSDVFTILMILVIRGLSPFVVFLSCVYFFSKIDSFINKTEIPKDKIDKLLSEAKKRLIALLTIGLNLSLIITFKHFYEFIPQLHCFTLGEIFDSAIVAIASLSITLIPLIYLISKPVKIFSKYRKAEPNLIKP
ncbi:serine/threonine-protein kinase [Okeania sp. SIO1F9]|uniref:serine/threonine protein kinase n=1 Tax=Okeania sp. SIO1F9 TaxID=2607813 RepID=UPI00144EA1CB|nr:serine/threonine-protein kinase [Okeania sp. SIO1F9]NET77439.1 serine/threonine protein kinase [Okeania sp. SIO1F9]